MAQPPFPPGAEADAIVNVGVMYGIFLVMIIMLVLMIYCYVKLDIFGKVLPVLIIWGFSIDIGFGSMPSPFFPFTPRFQIFFMLVQTAFLVLTALQLTNHHNGGK